MKVENPTRLDEAMELITKAVDKKLDFLLDPTKAGEGQLVEAMRYAMFAGGKRLRPFLVVACSDLFGVERSCSLRVAAAVECIHCYSLIHDDLPAMDDDDMRRGKPTTHKEYDEATAILAGDALQAIAFEILSSPETHADANVRCLLVAHLAKAIGMHGMVGGQMMDILATDKEMAIGEITHLQNMKTGALITYAVEAGALLGRATEHKNHLLKSYARDVGLAFQITDDLLDVRGDENKVGKALSKDDDKGKATFVSLLGVKRAQQQAEILVNQAVNALNEFGERAQLLKDLANFILIRDK